jgi:hypothetical protein
LRHSGIAVTQGSYIKSVSEIQIGALDLVAKQLGKEPICKDHATELKGSIN